MLRLVMTILWPSFLMAIVAEGLFFSLIDPHELMQLGGLHDWPPTAGYTLGFFFFWMTCALASMLTVYLLKVPADPPPPF